MTDPQYNRRQVLAGGAAAAMAVGASKSKLLRKKQRALAKAAAATPAAGSDLGAVEHVVFLMQENRSFDHYFGTYRGVNGFDTHTADFKQAWPVGRNGATTLLPFNLASATAQLCSGNSAIPTHQWAPQHESRGDGANAHFVSVHSEPAYDGIVNAPIVMGYFTRKQLGFYYALADAYTICDNYFCSVLGPTDPNRLYTMAASLDPDGKNGGPVLQTIVTNRTAFYGQLTYTTMPEQLQARGISWKVYSSLDETILGGILSDNVLSYFKNFQDPASVLHQNGFGPQFPVDFLADVALGNLPQVSWLVGSILTSDHPPSPSLFGENILSLIVGALSANPALWAKTVLLVTYDENGGFFDHVAPLTPPLGTPGEYVTAPAVPDPTVIGSPAISGPIGLGFRVPTLIISPFSRGGYVSSDLFDHTSVLRFIETRFGAEVPNLSAWRRAAVGDLTSAFNFKKPDQSI